MTMLLSDQAIRRRATSYLRQAPLEFYVQVLPGFEQAVASELAAVGYAASIERGGVRFHGDLSSVYQVNFALRSGNRLLMRLGEFLAQNYPMLYNRARAIRWEAVLGKCPTFCVRVSFAKSRLRHLSHIRKVVSDAVVARMRPFGLEPVCEKDGLLTIYVRLDRDRCILSLDTTGLHLHKRGYRRTKTVAPIRETTAAGVLLTAGSATYQVVVDPFCGSGTFPIEAELIARNVAPGKQRRIAFEHSPLHSPGTSRHLAKGLVEQETPCKQQILASDVSPEAIVVAQHNATVAGATHVSMKVANALELDFRSIAANAPKRLVVANLPYGHRMGSANSAEDLIEAFSRVLERTGRGWDYALVSPQALPIRNTALVTARRVDFDNGGIPVSLLIGTVRG